MSLKNDLEMVKEELTSEEKFFEKAVVTEKFVKKYKNVMIGSVVSVVLFVAGNIAYNVNEQNTIESANKTLQKLQTDNTNTAAQEKLKILSPTLSDVWLYSQAVTNKDLAVLAKLEKSNTIMISDLATYEAAQNAKSLKKLNEYSSKSDAVYLDLARMQAAIILINENKIDAARTKLSMINVDSPLAQVAKALMHYGVK